METPKLLLIRRNDRWYPRGFNPRLLSARQGQLDPRQQNEQRRHRLHAVVKPEEDRRHGSRTNRIP